MVYACIYETIIKIDIEFSQYSIPDHINTTLMTQFPVWEVTRLKKIECPIW